MFSALFRRLVPSTAPSLVHLTHAKAGSTWVDGILRELFGRNVARRFGGDSSKLRVRPGTVYSACFMTRSEFDAFPELAEFKKFIVIRDLRDTLVSRYFSMKTSHRPDASGAIDRHRQALATLSIEDGLLYVLNEGLQRAADIQLSWVGGRERLWRYEDLFRDDQRLFAELFLEELRLPISPAELSRVVEKHRFSNVFQRSPGIEDESSHGRQGTPGNWQAHFTPRVRKAFGEKFGRVLIATGYEPGLAWCDSE